MKVIITTNNDKLRTLSIRQQHFMSCYENVSFQSTPPQSVDSISNYAVTSHEISAMCIDIHHEAADHVTK